MSIINIDTLKNFLESQYARQLIFKTDNVEIILMCWLPGQGTPVHNHGTSDAITLVLEGEMDYTTYYSDDRKVSGTLRPGDIEHIPVGIEHEVNNNSKNKLVTLHVYSPPLDAALLPQTLGYSNEVTLTKVQVCEKVVSYLVADKPMVESSVSKNKTPITYPSSGSLTSKKPTVVIIGGGFSGTLVATHLMKKSVSEPLQVIMLERAPKFARGFAYSTNSPLHLLNVPAGKMSAFPDDPEHFLRWVQNRDLNINSNSFVSRMLYGEYLESVLHEAESKKSPATGFKRLNDEAVSIEVDSDSKKAKITLESGIQIPADKIVLAVGNYLPRNPNVKEKSFYQSRRYIRDPWSANALSMISPDDPILLIGTGLTMIDKAIELKCRGHRGIIHAVSRHGLVPQPHKSDIKPVEIKFDFDKDPVLTLRKLTRIIREKIKFATENNSDWRLVFDSLRPHIQNLWNNLSIDEKKRFFRHLRPYWDVHRHRMPQEVARVINSLTESKQLIIHKGRIKDYKENEEDVSVYLQRSASETDILQVAKVVNCTGSELDFCQIRDPLIVGLLEKGLIAPDKLSLGLEADNSGALKDLNGNISEFLYTLGPPLKGQLWETTAVPEIRGQAYSLASELLKSIANTLKNNMAQV